MFLYSNIKFKNFCYSKYDLYTKGGDLPNIEELIPYYQSLVAKYVPGILKW